MGGTGDECERVHGPNCVPTPCHGCESWTIKNAKELMPSNWGAGEDS